MVTRAYAILLGLTIAGFPLAATLATAVGVSVSPISVALRALVLALAIGLLLLQVLDHRLRPVGCWYWWPMFIFWVAYLGRMAHDTMTRSEALSLPPGEYWLWGVGACLVPALALFGRSRPFALTLAHRGVVCALIIAGVIVACLGDVLTTSGDGRVVYSTGRLHLAALNAISVGHLGASLLLVTAWPIIDRRRRVGVPVATLAAAGAGLGIYLVVAAASRGPIVAVLGTLMITGLVSDIRRGIRVLMVVLLVGGVGLALASGLEEEGAFAPVSRVATAIRAGDMTVAMRLEGMAGAASQFLAHPFLGDALEEESTAFYPHNVVLEAFMATGIVGGLAFLTLVLAAIVAAVRMLRAQRAEGWLGLLFLQYLLAAQVSGALYTSTVFWATLASCLAVGQRNRCGQGGKHGSSLPDDRGVP